MSTAQCFPWGDLNGRIPEHVLGLTEAVGALAVYNLHVFGDLRTPFANGAEAIPCTIMDAYHSSASRHQRITVIGSLCHGRRGGLGIIEGFHDSCRSGGMILARMTFHDETVARKDWGRRHSARRLLTSAWTTVQDTPEPSTITVLYVSGEEEAFYLLSLDGARYPLDSRRHHVSRGHHPIPQPK